MHSQQVGHCITMADHLYRVYPHPQGQNPNSYQGMCTSYPPLNPGRHTRNGANPTVRFITMRHVHPPYLFSLHTGPVLSFRIFNRRVIVINTYKAVTELLDGRSNIYSDRPQAWMLKEVIGRKWAVFNISSQQPRFKMYRKVLHTGLNSRAVRGYYPLFKQEARALLGRLQETPERFIEHVRRYGEAFYP